VLENRARTVDRAVSEIAVTMDFVHSSHDGIPVVDRGAVHLLDGTERTIAIAQNSGVAEVRVADEPSSHDAMGVPGVGHVETSQP